MLMYLDADFVYIVVNMDFYKIQLSAFGTFSYYS